MCGLWKRYLLLSPSNEPQFKSDSGPSLNSEQQTIKPSDKKSQRENERKRERHIERKKKKERAFLLRVQLEFWRGESRAQGLATRSAHNKHNNPNFWLSYDSVDSLSSLRHFYHMPSLAFSLSFNHSLSHSLRRRRSSQQHGQHQRPATAPAIRHPFSSCATIDEAASRRERTHTHSHQKCTPRTRTRHTHTLTSASALARPPLSTSLLADSSGHVRRALLPIESATGHSIRNHCSDCIVVASRPRRVTRAVLCARVVVFTTTTRCKPYPGIKRKQLDSTELWSVSRYGRVSVAFLVVVVVALALSVVTLFVRVHKHTHT